MFLDIEQFGHLHIIDENHIDMRRMYGKIRNIVAANQLGPKIYLQPIYTYYSSLLSDKIKLMTERVFEQDTIPKLPVTIMHLTTAAKLESKRWKRFAIKLVHSMKKQIKFALTIATFNFIYQKSRLGITKCFLIHFIQFHRNSFRSWKKSMPSLMKASF